MTNNFIVKDYFVAQNIVRINTQGVFYMALYRPSLQLWVLLSPRQTLGVHQNEIRENRVENRQGDMSCQNGKLVSW